MKKTLVTQQRAIGCVALCCSDIACVVKQAFEAISSELIENAFLMALCAPEDDGRAPSEELEPFEDSDLIFVHDSEYFPVTSPQKSQKVTPESDLSDLLSDSDFDGNC